MTNPVHQFMTDRGFKLEKVSFNQEYWKHTSQVYMVTPTDAKFWYRQDLKTRIDERILSKIGTISTREKIAINKRIKELETLLKESEEL